MWEWGKRVAPLSYRKLDILEELQTARKLLSAGEPPCSACRGVLTACCVDSQIAEIKAARRVNPTAPDVAELERLHRLEDPRT